MQEKNEQQAASPLLTIVIFGSPVITLIVFVAWMLGYVYLPIGNIVAAFVAALATCVVISGDITFLVMLADNKMRRKSWFAFPFVR